MSVLRPTGIFGVSGFLGHDHGELDHHPGAQVLEFASMADRQGPRCGVVLIGGCYRLFGRNSGSNLCSRLFLTVIRSKSEKLHVRIAMMQKLLRRTDFCAAQVSCSSSFSTSELRCRESEQHDSIKQSQSGVPRRLLLVIVPCTVRAARGET
jgi:hypothetical protein